MKHAFNLAHKVWGWAAGNPVMKIPMEKEPPSRDRWLIHEEENKLLAASPQWLQEIIIFAVETGCRRGEILSLECKDVDLFKRTVSVFGTKTGERRTIPLTERAFAVLLEKEKARAKVRSIAGNFVFSHPPGRKVNIYTLRSAFEDAIEKAGIQDFRFHDLRHTFASRLAQSGVDPYTIQKLMGHSSFTMTERYAHHFVESLRRGIEYYDASRIERGKNLAQF
jgi:integrase